MRVGAFAHFQSMQMATHVLFISLYACFKCMLCAVCSNTSSCRVFMEVTDYNIQGSLSHCFCSFEKCNLFHMNRYNFIHVRCRYTLFIAELRQAIHSPRITVYCCIKLLSEHYTEKHVMQMCVTDLFIEREEQSNKQNNAYQRQNL